VDKQEIAELKILQEIDSDNQATQRDLARHTGIGLSYINNYLKQLVKRELVLAQKMDGKRLLYNLTPKGMIEKARMSTEHAKWSLSNYLHIRQKAIDLCSELKQNNNKRIIICGISEAAEIVYIASIGCGLDLVGVVDNIRQNEIWLKNPVKPILSLKNCTDKFDFVIISDINRCHTLAQQLYEIEIPYDKMRLCTGQKIKPVTTVQLVD